jgi:hypothetical protein
MKARFGGMTPITIGLSLGNRNPLNLQIMADTRWLVCLTECLSTIHLFYQSIKSNVQYGSVRPTGANCSTDPQAIVQLPRHTMTFPPLLSGAHTEPNFQGASALWCLGDCRVSYASHDELHLTIVLKKSPPA